MIINPVLFENIYKNTLYAIVPPITIVIDEPWEKLETENKELLEKILLSVKLSMASARIICHSNFDFTLMIELSPKIIVFGDAPTGINQYEVIQNEKSKILFSSPLSQIATEPSLKQKLWESLKLLFPK